MHSGVNNTSQFIIKKKNITTTTNNNMMTTTPWLAGEKKALDYLKSKLVIYSQFKNYTIKSTSYFLLE